MTDNASSSTGNTDRTADLSAVRVEIDAVDDQIHALLIRRAELVQQVAATKRQPDGTLPRGAYRPAREAHIHRRLYSQNRPPLPFGTVFRLWREMIGTFTAIQSPVTVSMHTGGDSGLARIAREHFGTAAEIEDRATCHAVSQDVTSAPGTVGVVPVDAPGDAWWTACLDNSESAPNVIAAIPCYGRALSGYCLSLSMPEPSGDDCTLLAVRLGAKDPQAALQAAGIEADILATHGDAALLRLAGFHAAPDGEARRSLAAALGLADTDIATVGAYPVPIAQETA
jgi:chorismate mutase-like protein